MHSPGAESKGSSGDDGPTTDGGDTTAFDDATMRLPIPAGHAHMGYDPEGPPPPQDSDEPTIRSLLGAAGGQVTRFRRRGNTVGEASLKFFLLLMLIATFAMAVTNTARFGHGRTIPAPPKVGAFVLRSENGEVAWFDDNDYEFP